MTRYIKSTLLILLISNLLSTVAIAQEEPSPPVNMRNDAVKVFIDCNSCDMNYTRQEIPWVNYVRDVRERLRFMYSLPDRIQAMAVTFSHTLFTGWTSMPAWTTL